MVTACPAYRLDYSWPSVGLLDHFTYFLRGKESYSEKEELFISGVAAYLAGIAHDTWAHFPDDLQIELKLAENERKDVFLHVQGGKFLAEEKFTIHVNDALSQVLRSPATPFPVFEHHARFVHQESNLLSLFGIGLVTGLCPYGTGPWKDVPVKDFAPYLIETEVLLAGSAATHYARLFPTELLGQSIELYLANLILPPLLYNEPFVASRAVRNLLAYLKEKETPIENMMQLASNLLLSPDDILFSAGFALSVAFVDEAKLSQRLVAIGEAQMPLLPELRAATMIARKILGKPFDWQQELLRKNYTGAKTLIDIEKKVGLLPYWSLSDSLLEVEELLPLFEALAWSNPLAAREIIDELAESQSLHPDVVLQGIFLDLSLGDLARAEQELAQFQAKYDEATHPLFYNALDLQGMAAILKGDLQAAVRIFENVFSRKIEDTNRKLAIGQNYIWCLNMLGQFDQALKVIDVVSLHSPYSPTLKLSRAYSLEGKGQLGDSAIEIKELTTYAPMDRRVFENFLLLSKGE